MKDGRADTAGKEAGRWMAGMRELSLRQLGQNKAPSAPGGLGRHPRAGEGTEAF